MVLRKLWNIFLCLLTSAIATGNTLNGNDRDIVDTIAGERVIIKAWSLKGSPLSINVKRDNSILLDVFLDDSADKHNTVQNGRLTMKYNHTIKEISLMFDKVSREDEGLYEIEESLYRSIEFSHEIETEGYERRYDRWSLELNVLGQHEVKQSYAGENIIMEFGKTSEQSLIYNYDQAVALLFVSACSILTDSNWYGRLRCTSDDMDKMYKLTIEKVTQRDSGLYEVTTGRDKVWRCLLNIKDKPTRAVVGENMRIGWFYNQQGMNRTLLVIHPNQEVMMLVLRTNVPQVKNSFQHRLLYNGDTSRSFMLFTLLNVRQSDAGLYTIETVHRNTIPGSKELVVEGLNRTVLVIHPNQEVMMLPPTNISQIKSNFLHWLLYSRDASSSFIIFTLLNVRHSDAGLHTIRTIHGSNIPGSKVLIVDAKKIINVQRNGTSTLATDQYSECPNLPIPVAIGVIAFGVISLMICRLIRIQRKITSDMETDLRHAHEECNTDLYLTPIGVDTPMPIPLTKDGRASNVNTAHSGQFDSSLLLLHRTQNLCMDGYEMVDMSNNDDPQGPFNNERAICKGNICDSSETVNTPIQDIYGYLTVLGVTDTSV